MASPSKVPDRQRGRAADPITKAVVHVTKRGRPTADQSAAISRLILETSTHLFLNQGFERTSMDAVASRSGVPRSTLYKRFADKRALLRAVIFERIEVWSEINTRKNWMLSENLVERLEFYATWILSWATNPEVSAFTQLATHAWPSPEDVDERMDVLGQTRMVDMIEDDIKIFAPGAGIELKDPRRVALTLMAMLAGWLTLRSSNQPLSDDDARERAHYLVGILFDGKHAW